MKLVLALVLLVVPQQAEAEKKLKEKADDLEAIIKATQKVETITGVAGALLSLCDDAIQIDAYDLAAKLTDRAAQLAKGLKNQELLARAQIRQTEAKAIQSEYNKIKDKILVDTPENNLAVGKFIALHKGDWTVATEILAKCSDPELKSAAEANNGDAWWKVAEKRKGIEKDKFRLHALDFYRDAWPKLGEADKEIVKARAYSVLVNEKANSKSDLPIPWKKGWGVTNQVWRDERAAHTGRFSIAIAPYTPKSSFDFSTEEIPVIPGRKYVASLWVLGNGGGTFSADKMRTVLYVQLKKPTGELVLEVTSSDLPHKPFWTKVEVELTIGKDIGKISVYARRGDLTGDVWIDDISLKDDQGKELLENGSFERK